MLTWSFAFARAIVFSNFRANRENSRITTGTKLESAGLPYIVQISSLKTLQITFASLGHANAFANLRDSKEMRDHHYRKMRISSTSLSVFRLAPCQHGRWHFSYGRTIAFANFEHSKKITNLKLVDDADIVHGRFLRTCEILFFTWRRGRLRLVQIDNYYFQIERYLRCHCSVKDSDMFVYARANVLNLLAQRYSDPCETLFWFDFWKRGRMHLFVRLWGSYLWALEFAIISRWLLQQTRSDYDYKCAHTFQSRIPQTHLEHSRMINRTLRWLLRLTLASAFSSCAGRFH